MTVRWSEQASADLANIYSFLAAQNEDAAFAAVKGIGEAVNQLGNFPQLGRRAADFPGQGRRKLVHPPFVILYRVTANTVLVDAIFHGSRRYD